MKKISVFCCLLTLSLLQAINIADYGAGPMVKPGRTFYVSTKGNNVADRTIASDHFAFGGGHENAGIPIIAKRELFADDIILRGIASDTATADLQFRSTAGDFIVRETFAAQEEILLVLFVGREADAFDPLAQFSIRPNRRVGGCRFRTNPNLVFPYGIQFSHLSCLPF